MALATTRGTCQTWSRTPAMKQGDVPDQISGIVDTRMVRQSPGVFGRFIPCAIAAGDTFIFRQARRSPCLMQDIREMLMDIGLPAGAVGVVHGGAGAAGSRYEDEHIAGV